VLVGKALREVGFELLDPLKDATRDDMLFGVHALADKLRKAGPGAIGFLYYTGHGIGVGGDNVLIPKNVQGTSDAELNIRGVKLAEVLDILKQNAPHAVHFIVLDACRNNIRGAKGAKGFVPVVDHRTGMVIAFATAAGEVASDEGSDSGPYAAALAAELVKAGQNDQQVFNSVRSRVVEVTGKQTPWTYDGLVGERVVFRGRAPSGPSEIEQQLELTFWATVKDSKNPQMLKLYLARYPNGIFAGLAILMIAQAEQEEGHRTIQTLHEEEARQARLAKQVAEEKRLDAEREARAAEAAMQQGKLIQALAEAQKAREALEAAERDRRAAQQAADEAKGLADALKSEREAQTEAAQKWATVKDATNVSVLEAFIKQFGNTIYGATARARLEEIKKQQVAVVTPPTKGETGQQKADPAHKRAEDEAQARAEQAVRQRLAAQQQQQEDQKKLAEAKAAQRPESTMLPAGVVRANLAAASVLRALAVSPNGKELAVSADDGIIRIIDLATFRVVRRLPETSDGTTTKSLAYSGDGSLLIAGRFNGRIEIWNTATGSKAEDLKSASSKVFAVGYYPPELHRWAVTAGSEGVEIWNMKSKTVAGRPGLHKGPVRALAYSSEKSGNFVTGGEDGQLIFYLPSNRQKPVQAHRGGVFGAAFSSDNSMVVSGGADGLVKIWNAQTQSEQRSLQGHTRYVLSVALSKSAARIASGGADKSVRVWSVQSGQALHVLEGHEKDVEYVGFLRADDLVVSISEDRTLRVWDAVRGRHLLTAAFYADGDYVAYTSKGLFTGTPNVSRRLEIGTGAQPRALSDGDQQSLFKPEGFGVDKLAER
jgi:WD40 repeat protein